MSIMTSIEVAVQDTAGSDHSALEVFVGIDTHKHTHHVAVVDRDGREIDDKQFTTDTAGLKALHVWLGRWSVVKVGIEQPGTYGAGIAAVLMAAGLMVIDINIPDVTTRARSGKSDPLDARAAANAVRTGRIAVMAKNREGIIEAIRHLHGARQALVRTRAAALTRIGAVAITVPAGLRDQLGSTSRQIAVSSLRLRPDTARLSDPSQAAKLALRVLARQIADLDEQVAELDAALTPLVSQAAPRLLARPQVGIVAAAQLLVTAGQNPERIRSDAAFARLIGVAPIPASSGQTRRMRLHRGGDRQANKTVHMIAVGRLKSYEPARSYIARRTSEGLSKKDAIRAMKRHITRELHGALKADLKALDEL